MKQDLLDKQDKTRKTIIIDDDISVMERIGWKNFATLMGSKQKKNFNKMDKLIEALGYLDYRDLLAANKYMLESKKKSNYHKYARGQVLAAAMGRLEYIISNESKKTIENKVSEAKATPNITEEELQDFKLKVLLEEVPEFKQQYRDHYKQNQYTMEYNKVFSYINDNTKLQKQQAESNKVADNESILSDMPIWSGNLHAFSVSAQNELNYLNSKIEEVKNQDTLKNLDRIWGEPDKKLERRKEISESMQSIRDQLIFTTEIRSLDREHYLKTHRDEKVGFYKYIANDPDNLVNNNEMRDLHPEMPINIPDEYNTKIYDEKSQQKAEFVDKMSNQYLEAKWNWYIDTKMNSLKKMSTDLKEIIRIYKRHEGGYKERLEFMYNHFDYENDRTRVRNKLAHKMHKKTTLKDIGEILDEMIFDEQQSTNNHLKIEPESLNRDYHLHDLYASIKEITHAKKIKPSFVEDPESIDRFMQRDKIDAYKEYVEQVKTEDFSRDHSKEALSNSEKFELEVYKSIKKDPYYKHYILNCFRYETEYFNGKLDDVSKAMVADISSNYNLRIRYDPIQVPNIQTMKKGNEFLAQVYDGKAWGSGRRK